MKIFGMGLPELILILVVVLVIFGPKNLPKLGGLLGRTVKKLRGRVEDDTQTASPPTCLGSAEQQGSNQTTSILDGDQIGCFYQGAAHYQQVRQSTFIAHEHFRRTIIGE